MFKGRKFNAITMIRAFRSRIQSLKKTPNAPDVKHMLRTVGANKKTAKKNRDSSGLFRQGPVDQF